MPDLVENVYAPPATPVDAQPEPASEHEALRRACIGRETGIKSLGSLTLLGAVLPGLGLVMALVLDSGRTGLAMAGLQGALLAVCLVQGIGLYRLQPWARGLATAVLGLGLLSQVVLGVSGLVRDGSAAVLIGVAIPVAIFTALLWQLWSKPAATVFSAHYRTVVIPATPHVRYRTPGRLWAVVGLILLAVIGLVLSIALRP